MIWHVVLLNFGVSFDVLVSRKDVFSEYIQIIDTHIYVFVKILELHISVSF